MGREERGVDRERERTENECVHIFSFHRNHTLAVVRSSGKVYSFGRGDSGQLGTGGPSTHKIPVPVAGEWLPPSSLPELGDRREDDEVEDMEVECVGVVTSEQWVVRRIFAGGDQSFATLAVPTVVSNLIYN